MMHGPKNVKLSSLLALSINRYLCIPP